MPEGHTIHRAARDHEALFQGQTLRVSSPQGRFDIDELVDSRGRATLLRVEAYGKHLFYIFEPERIVHVHLGLFGKFFKRKTPAPPPKSTTRMRLEGEHATLDLIGPTACEVITSQEMFDITQRLGPDPLRLDANPRPFYRYVGQTKTPIGAILMDQSRICGVGNVYRAEVLHLLKIHPQTPGAEVPTESVKALWRLTVGLLRRGVEEKRIVTTRGLKLSSPKERVPRSESTHVYRQKFCRSCEGPVTSYTLRARVVYCCEACQPLNE